MTRYPSHPGPPRLRSKDEFERFERFTRSRRAFLSSGMRTAMAIAALKYLPGQVHADSDLGHLLDQSKGRLFGPADPTRRKAVGAQVGERTNLTAANIRVKGFWRLPGATSGLQSVSYAGMNSVTYAPSRGTMFLGAGASGAAQSTLYEITFPVGAPGATPRTGPILPCLANWGQYILGKLQPTGGSYAVAFIDWDARTEGLYTWYNVSYQLGNNPTLVWTRFNGTAAQRVANPATYVAETLGGWRASTSAWPLWGGFVTCPQDWADLYLGGYPVAFGGGRSKSGVGHSHGPGLSSSDMHLFAPATTPIDPGGHSTPVGTAYSITAQRKIWLDGQGAESEQIRTNTVSKMCGFPLPDRTCTSYPSDAPLSMAEQVFGTQNTASGETDSVVAQRFFDNGSQWGFLNFCSMPHTPPGYSPTIIASGQDPDGIIHRGYSDLTNSFWYHSDPADPLFGTTTAWVPDKSCCHSMIDWHFSSTGPWAICREKWILGWNPDSYAASITSGNLAYFDNTYADWTLNIRDLLEAFTGLTFPYTGTDAGAGEIGGSFNGSLGGPIVVGNRILMLLEDFENSRNSAGTEVANGTWRPVLVELEVVP